MSTIHVKKLPRDPGPAAWNVILPPPPPPRPLEEETTADWLVIGAGLAGLAAARRLTVNRPEDSIAVLDAVRVGEGPAGRNSGFMIDLPHDLASADYGGAVEKDRRQIAANRAAIDVALETARDFGLSGEAIARTGKLNAAASEAGLAQNRSYAEHLEKLGEPYELLDTERMRELTGSDYYIGGIYTPGAAMIQPALYVRGVAAGLLQSNRVRLYENSPVTSLSAEDGVWRAETPRGSVTAPRVILAVNGHAESFGFFARQLMHVFTYASMTRTLDEAEVAAIGGARDWGVLPAHPMGTTVRRISGTGGDRIVVRNRFTYDPSMEVSDTRIATVGRDHDKAFEARFPALRGVEMEHRWGGRLCLARNDVPAFGEVAEGLFAACCQNGLGTVKGTFSGIAAADLACGIESDFTRHQTALPQPESLPPEPLSWIGANAFMRWGEWKAGREL